MIVTVRIYKRHDPDLVHLIENYEFDIKKAVYCALSGYIKGEVFVISLPKKRDVPYITSGRIIRGDLRLNEMEDEALIRFISQIPGGERNCALKTILRLYLRLPINEEWAREYNLALQGKIRRADAAQIKKQTRTRKTKLVSFQDKPEKNIKKEEKKQNNVRIEPIKEEPEEKMQEFNEPDADDLTDLFQALVEH